MALSPMMQQYTLLKEQHKDCLLFFRLGDFYEMFFEDAELAARELEITLTSRDCGLSQRAPMCGVPYHSVEGYIARLIDRGYKVAVCEQMTDPAESRGLVERGVVRVVTAGTLTEPDMLEEKRNNYLLSVYLDDSGAGLCWADISTGEMTIEELRRVTTGDALREAWTRVDPAEIIVNQAMAVEIAGNAEGKTVSLRPDTDFDLKRARFVLDRRLPMPLRHYGCEKMTLALRAAGALLEYLKMTQKNETAAFASMTVYQRGAHMTLDPIARQNLELTQTIRGRTRKGTLLWLLDETATAMGARQLRAWIEEPLLDVGQIDARLDAVGEFRDDPPLAGELGEQLRGVYDMERLLARVTYGSINPRECLGLQKSLERVPGIQALLSGAQSSSLRRVVEELDPLEDLRELLTRAIVEEPPIAIRDGGIFRDGYHKELDELRAASLNGQGWLSDLEARERETTGIKSLKMGYNKVFGYYIEVTRANLGQVPYHYQRKQTVANGERFITEDLKKIEEALLGAQEKAVRLEHRLFIELRDILLTKVARLQKTAQAIKRIDALLSLGKVAYSHGYCRPQVHEGFDLVIEGGRHPVVERVSDDPFVPNDTHLTEEERTAVITGPNMAGKSTYMRQVALITLMAHIGSFVPAAAARVPLTDSIHTRVGASDDLGAGQSTFMVEMRELAAMLSRATRRSLLILDEIGRGTSTFDGLSIAWATVEHIAATQKLGAKALFATHYHELTELEGRLPGVVNYFVDCKELGEDIIFLRQIRRGGADRSYGVHVAALAGLPQTLVARSREILARLEVDDVSRRSISGTILEKPRGKQGQVSLQDFSAIELAQELAAIDVNGMTPMDALNALYRLREKALRI